jgi:molecular chaperone IbpA
MVRSIHTFIAADAQNEVREHHIAYFLRISIMRTYDFSPLYRSAIGFDRLAQLFDDAQRIDSQPSYPPYNIELVTEDKYRISMAIAGFNRSELEIETEHDTLKIVGRKHRDEMKRTFLHRGIAARDFEHRFQLADHVKVISAKFDNGLLDIELVREIPEALKPRKIVIDGGDNVHRLEQREAA